MIFALAPMEGITGHLFREVHAACFGRLERYYTPFLKPPQPGSGFGERELKELGADAPDPDLVPQLLARTPDEFVWAAELLADMGFCEVNLNAGCPSRTVTSKGKGAGLLRDPARLDEFLAEITERSPIPVSVKCRIGIADRAEYGQLLKIFCRYPLSELIVHPRLLKQGYAGKPDWDAFGETLGQAPFPVAYSGDIFSLGDLEAFRRRFPEAGRVLLGRGILANPALGRMAEGGPAATACELEEFHGRLFEGYEERIGGNAVFRMKEWWSYAMYAFEDPVSVWRRVRKAKKAAEYAAAAASIFADEPLAPEASYGRRSS